MKYTHTTKVIEVMSRSGDSTNVGHLLKVFWWMTHPFLPKVTEAEASMVVQTLNGVLLVEDVDPSGYATSWAADIREIMGPARRVCVHGIDGRIRWGNGEVTLVLSKSGVRW